MQFPLVHISWALPDNAQRPACDAFFMDVFGAQTAYEMLITPETEHYGFDREERLTMVADAMLIPIAPAGGGEKPGSPLGDMLRRSAAPMRWIGLALKAHDLAAADVWFESRGFKRFYDPGMESHYFLVPRGAVMGVRLEIVKQDMPGDPRRDAAWLPSMDPAANPLGIEGLQAVGVSVPSLDEADALFAERLGFAPLGRREDAEARIAAYWMGDTVIEALEARDPDSALAAHAREKLGIWHLAFKVRDARAAAGQLMARGFTLAGTTADRFALLPEDAHGRLIWLTEQVPDGYPPAGSRLGKD